MISVRFVTYRCTPIINGIDLLWKSSSAFHDNYLNGIGTKLSLDTFITLR